MVTHNQLVYLIEIVRQRSFTRAAEKLFLSQSTLSKSIHALEAELQVELIDRQSKDFALTEAGELTYAYAQRIVDFVSGQTQELNQRLRGLGGTLTVGLPPTAGPAYFYPRLYEFRQRYPNIQLNIRETPAKTICEMMEAGKIDIGIVLEPLENPAYVVRPVYRSEIVLCVSRDHPLAERGTVALRELKDADFLMMSPDFMFRDIVEGHCRQAGFAPRVVFESSQWDMIYDMAATGYGVAFFGRWLMEKMGGEGTRMLQVSDPPMPWILSVCYLKDKFLTEPMRRFLTICTAEKL